ncbi:CatB-related O-acetyltransferase [Mycetocola zhadangensis]|uniref:CatB-related O-acetyltransferase n=1 Tax=Mycetocola zhadangensis TaxID=1164595 RepID=UPI003A4D2D7A
MGAPTQQLRMRTSPVSTLLVGLYNRLPNKRGLVRAIARLEGGQLFSTSLRKLLKGSYGVTVGPFSYGSLLDPGMADRGTSIGPYVSVGPNVRRFGAAHPLDALSMHPFWYNPTLGQVDPSNDVERTPCEIGAEAWIGANVTILPGCRRIGVGAVIGAGSVVTKDVADFAIVVGSPAREVSVRLTPELREALLESRPWESEPDVARSVYLNLSAASSERTPDARH